MATPLPTPLQATAHDFVTTGVGTEDLSEAMLGATEWYSAANADCFVQFDSLDDLEAKVRTTDFGERRRRLRRWAQAHTNTTRARWQMLDRFLLRDGAGAVPEEQTRSLPTHHHSAGQVGLKGGGAATAAAIAADLPAELAGQSDA